MLSKGVQQAKSTANDWVGGRNGVRGRICTVNLSDVVIVCQIPQGAELASSNLKDFVPSAQAARRRVSDPIGK